MAETAVIEPTAAHLTLLLKCGRSTTFLSVLPETTLLNLKTQLLQVLSARDTMHFPGSDEPLPADPEDLDLGILLDRHEPDKGWVYAEDRTGLETSKFKKKSKGTVDTVADLDLKDGGWIAYRLRPQADEDDLVQDPGWYVILPSFEDEEDHEEQDEDENMDIPLPVSRNKIAR